MTVEATKKYVRVMGPALAVFVAMALPNTGRLHAEPQHLIRVADNSLCLDSMETEPDNDDQDVTLVALTDDGGCLRPDETISV